MSSTALSVAFAQSAAPGATTMLDPIVVQTDENGTLGVIAERLWLLPGGVSLVSKQDYGTLVAATLSDALAGVPGVVVQDFSGANDQPDSSGCGRGWDGLLRVQRLCEGHDANPANYWQLYRAVVV